MTLPPKLHDKALQQFDELISKAPILVSEMDNNNRRYHASNPMVVMVGGAYAQETEYFAFVTQSVSLIRLILGKTDRANELIKSIQELDNRPSSIRRIQGYLIGLKSDYEKGMLVSIHELIASDIIADYLQYAEQLLSEGKVSNFDYVTATVMIGAVLEDSLRRLCSRQNPTIPITKPNGQNKTMGMLIEELKKSGLFNELKAKRLRAWADIRNAAAHGRFTDFKRSDTEEMISGVQNFLQDYL